MAAAPSFPFVVCAMGSDGIFPQVVVRIEREKEGEALGRAPARQGHIKAEEHWWGKEMELDAELFVWCLICEQTEGFSGQNY